jgi:hypothetical protein
MDEVSSYVCLDLPSLDGKAARKIVPLAKTVEKDMPNLRDIIKGGWDNRASEKSYMKIFGGTQDEGRLRLESKEHRRCYSRNQHD